MSVFRIAERPILTELWLNIRAIVTAVEDPEPHRWLWAKPKFDLSMVATKDWRIYIRLSDDFY